MSKSIQSKNEQFKSYHTLFRINHVPVKANLGFFLIWTALWGLLTWISGRRNPERGLWERLSTGLLATLIPVSADVGHAVAHSFSAAAAGAPMDEIRLGMDMPRTMYLNHRVTPQQHILRALGGPLYNFIGLLTGIGWQVFSKTHSLGGDLADLMTLSHGLLFFGSLLPFRIIDGGVILKWLLVLQGKDERTADALVKGLGLGLGAGLGAVGIGLFWYGRKFLGLITAGAGGISTSIAAGWIE